MQLPLQFFLLEHCLPLVMVNFFSLELQLLHEVILDSEILALQCKNKTNTLRNCNFC